MKTINNPIHTVLRAAGPQGVTIEELIAVTGKSRSAINQTISKHRAAWKIDAAPERTERHTTHGATIVVNRYRLRGNEVVTPKQTVSHNTGVAAAVMDTLKDYKPTTRGEIRAQVSSYSESAVNGALASLCSTGQIVRVGYATYQATGTPKEGAQVSEQRATRVCWTEEELAALAEAVFLEMLVDPTVGVNNGELLMRAVKATLPPHRWRQVSGVSQMEGIMKHLNPKLTKWSNSWLDPETVQVEVEKPVDSMMVLEQATEGQLLAALLKLSTTRASVQATKDAEVLELLNTILAGQKEMVEQRINVPASSRVLIPTTVVHPSQPTPRVFIAGIKKNRLREILGKLEGPMEIVDAWYCDDKEKRTHSVKDVPDGADVYFINTRQLGHTDQAAVKEKLNTNFKHLLRYSIGTHPLEQYLKEIAKNGIETFMAKPHMYRQ